MHSFLSKDEESISQNVAGGALCKQEKFAN